MRRNPGTIEARASSGIPRSPRPARGQALLVHDRRPTREGVPLRDGVYPDEAAGPFGQSLLEPQREWTAEDLAAAATENPGTPRGEFFYSNTNYIVLGDLVTQVTGQDCAAFVKDRVLDPVGLPDTIIPSQTDTAPVGTHGSSTTHRSSTTAGPISPTRPRRRWRRPGERTRT